MSEQKFREPEASRPSMPPEYGILDATQGRGLLPWAWAAERLANSRHYWIATTRRDGRPHLMPVWGIWLDDKFYFSTDTRSQKGQNLARNPNCAVHTEPADEAVIVEGVVQRVRDATVLEQFVEVYGKKYQEEIDTEQFPVYAVQPRIAFAFISTPGEWNGSITRWRFR